MTKARIIPAKTHYSVTQVSRSTLVLAAALLCLLSVQPVFAATAVDAFADGNRLFRDDLYWAALLRYKQAGDAGMNTPMLHYNMGVAHYRATQHIRARESLTKALVSPGLRVISQYNLGLNAYAAGDVDEALRWFRLARDQYENAQISRLARIAISRLQRKKQTTDTYLVRAEQERKKRDIADFSFRALVGFGNDDNVFRSPSQPYIDFSDPALPLIVPVVQSGAYIPASFSAKYSINSFEYESFYAAYDFVGHFYQDKEIDNGDEFSQQFSIGSEYVRKQGTRTREVYSAFTVAQHDETYFDPDDGAGRTSNGESIDDRMDYLRYGPELVLRQSHDRLSFGARMKGQLWNYDDIPGAASDYDHEFVVVGLNTQYKFTPTSLLRISVEGYTRRFGNRPSYDLDGIPRLGNPDVQYDYLEYGLVARQRLYSRLWFGVYYEHTDRDDKYVGYNNYSRDEFGLNLTWSPSPKFRVRLSGDYRTYDFSNAFAFNNPIVGPRTLEAADGELTATFRMTRNLSLILEAYYHESSSNDTRIDYDRSRYALGIRWQQ
jgi:tetratricopeptide (TPR) repeat protein